MKSTLFFLVKDNIYNLAIKLRTPISRLPCPDEFQHHLNFVKGTKNRARVLHLTDVLTYSTSLIISVDISIFFNVLNLSC